MKSLMKIIGFTFIVLIVLSLHIHNKPIFQYIYSALSPTTKPIETSVKEVAEAGWNKGKSVAKKIIHHRDTISDQVKHKASSLNKNTEGMEVVSEKEKEQVDELIKNHHK